MTFEDDCRIVYLNIQKGIVTLEALIAFIEEEKAHAYIDGIIRGTLKGEEE